MKKPGRKHDVGNKQDNASADADIDHFARAMSDVVPLEPDPRGRARIRRPITKPNADKTVSISMTAGIVTHRATLLESPSDDTFVVPGVDRRELRKLKRGEHVPTNRLDLHGKTATEAVTSLKRFVGAARHRHRCVCIVHGRGLHSEGKVAILKTIVRECLRLHPAVLAYSDAPRTDGGCGAVYVLLRQ